MVRALLALLALALLAPSAHAAGPEVAIAACDAAFNPGSGGWSYTVECAGASVTVCHSDRDWCERTVEAGLGSLQPTAAATPGADVAVVRTAPCAVSSNIGSGGESHTIDCGVVSVTVCREDIQGWCDHLVDAL